jgi:hypothetical protein
LGEELFNKHSKKYSQALDDDEKGVRNAGQCEHFFCGILITALDTHK